MPPRIPDLASDDQRHIIFILLVLSTIVALAVAGISILSGWLTIFQNLFYIPIIIACVYYTKKGFIFSVILSWCYFFMILAVSRDPVVIEGALIRVAIFILVAGVITYISGIQVKTEKALRESEGRYSSLFDNNYSVSLLIDPDTARIVEANDAACEYYGFSRTELLEKKISDINHLPEDKVIRDLQRARQEGRKHFFSTHYLAGGEKREVEVYSGPISLQGRPLFYSIVHDITDRKLAEEALHRSEEKYRSLFRNMIDGFAYCRMVYDDQGRPVDFVYLEVNPAFGQLTGLQDVAGRKVTEVIPGIRESNPEIFEIYGRVAATGRPERFETYLAPLRIWFNVSVFSPEKDYFVAVFEDVTQRKLMEDALQLANRKLNLLSSITRHDILNQLTVLRGYLDLSRSSVDDPSALVAFLGREETAARNIERQITFTREYQDLGVNTPTWQDVQYLIREVSTAFTPGNVRIAADLEGIWIYADPLLEKVFYNLIDNALRYGGGRMTFIRFSAETTDHELVIACEDDGTGIPPSDKERVFERGFGKNTGLGLFLSREILAITGITIREIGVQGEGARFEIRVPEGTYRVD